MNYLFIILGFDSFYEITVMLKMLDQMPSGSHVLVFASELASTYLLGDERVFLMPTGLEKIDNQKLFNQTIKEGDITSVFVFDYHKTLFTQKYNHDYMIIPFEPEWLDDLEIPVCIVDCYDMFNFNEEGNLYLITSSEFNAEDEAPIDDERSEYDELYDRALLGDNPHEISEYEKSNYRSDKPDVIVRAEINPYIIKLCPTNQADALNDNERFIFWDYGHTEFETAETDKMKSSLGITPNKKNILLNFSYQFIFRSVLNNQAPHYLRVITSLIIYLKRLNLDVNLFIMGADSSISQLPILRGTKINVKAFRDPNYNMYKALMSYADVVITDTTWHPCLIDASALEIPTGVIGNSMQIMPDGSCLADFSETDLEVFQELEKAIQQAPQTLFPYSSYPLREHEMPYFGYYEDKYMYYLLDIYSDESVIAFLGQFLVKGEDDEVSSNLKERFKEYNSRSDGAIRTDKLIYFFEGYEM